ncbi:excinuclease ABC subunit UvrC [Desulfovibrio litoralis]|uniref:UvrABC system protein C n=1 Tax=Desulfovibrio litoralis DSM 11393 TaxID=1121455 RepID=A0A1M7TIQ6_9BACT|nr:excinuclease ABC subunit UvrC [Desulfovibrio litoralis]SHN70632.1 Excinuclease ABC subunit C [Desulfovibrio litoralis DSM 11393]
MQTPDFQSIPTTPGIYIFQDIKERPIYVGKAKILRNRVSSYFRNEKDLTPKTRAMLSHAHALNFISTTSEKEALLLEASLIKKHRPRYNILLKDDKDHILFRFFLNHPYPRLEILRRPQMLGHKKSQALLFGPYSNSGAARETWRSIHKAYPLRRCTDKAMKNRVRPCLYHYLGQCLAPCVLDVEKETYTKLVKEVSMLLSGRSAELIKTLKHDMLNASELLDFEKAACLRDRIKNLEHTVEQQAVVFPDGGDLDVVGFAERSYGLALCILFIRQGALIDNRTFTWQGLSLEEAPTILPSVLLQYYQNAALIPPRILLPWALNNDDEANFTDNNIPEQCDENKLKTPKTENILAELLSSLRNGNVKISVAKEANKDAENRLIELAVTNARQALISAEKNPENIPMHQLLAEKLHLKRPVYRIEAVDISHTGGTNVRAGMVVFEDGKALKSAYRSYIIDNNTEQNLSDDYASLSQWAKRRVESGPPWADLVLIDGGKGQLAAVVHAFKQAGLSIGNKESDDFAVISIAKARTEEGRTDRRAGNISDRIFMPERSNPINFKAGSSELLFLQLVRDSVHDFVIGQHRKARSKTALQAELLRLPGIGEKTARLLLTHFGSTKEILLAKEEGLAEIAGLGKQKAKQIWSLLNSKN